MSYDDAMEALSNDALKLIKNNQVIGLGSGRAATMLVKSLAKLIKLKNYNIKGIPTSLQIKLVAEKAGIQLVESDQVNHIDIVFDGADQIDSEKFVIKGGGGALLRENILFSLAKKVVVMADKTKFVKNFTRTVPVEIHPSARNSVINSIKKLGGESKIRSLDRGYTFFTENGVSKYYNNQTFPIEMVLLPERGRSLFSREEQNEVVVPIHLSIQMAYRKMTWPKPLSLNRLSL